MVKFTWPGLGSVWALDLETAICIAVDEFCGTPDPEQGADYYDYIWLTKPQISVV
jgi:hypothetical protein